MIWLAIFGLIMLVAAVPFLFEKQRVTISAADRQRSGGKFASLPNCLTHYRWHGPESGPVFVAIHGLTTPSVVWDDILPAVIARGFRVLSYDLYGRGLSDAPAGPQDLGFFVAQLAALLDDQEVKEPVSLIGYSMGGSIATEYAAANISMVDRIVLVAPAGIAMSWNWFDQLTCQVPWLGDWVHASFSAGRMRRRSSKTKKPNAIVDMQRFQLSRRGYLPAVLASMRGALAVVQKDAHQRIAKAGIPVLAIWARNDTAVPLRGLGTLATWNRDAEQIDVAGAGHSLPYTHAGVISQEIDRWLTTTTQR